MKQDKLLALESLRGIAAISVAFFHFNVGSHLNNNFVQNAWLMVDFFFVLSGFVIALNYTDQLKTLGDVAKFQFKRFLRLYPLHLLMLILFLGIEFAKYFAEINFGMVANNRAFSENNFTAFTANLFLIQNLTLPGLTFNYPSWSISAEFFTYALFAVLVLNCKLHRTLLSIVLLACVVIFGVTLNEIGMGIGNITGGPLRCLYSFSIGALIFLIYSRLIVAGIIINSAIPMMLIIFSVGAISKYGFKDFDFVVLFPVLFGAVILSIALNNKENYLNKFLSMDCLVYLGTISYGIYMIHAFVWWIMIQTFRFLLKVPTTTDPEGKSRILIENIFIADLVCIMGISVVIILAHISFKYYESKFTVLYKSDKKIY